MENLGYRVMKKYQMVALIGGAILVVVSLMPVFSALSAGVSLWREQIRGVFIFPVIGGAVALIIIFLAFWKDGE
jgi:hypothetical protein